MDNDTQRKDGLAALHHRMNSEKAVVEDWFSMTDRGIDDLRLDYEEHVREVSSRINTLDKHVGYSADARSRQGKELAALESKVDSLEKSTVALKLVTYASVSFTLGVAVALPLAWAILELFIK